MTVGTGKPFRKSNLRIQTEHQSHKRIKEEDRLKASRELQKTNASISFVSNWQQTAVANAVRHDAKRRDELGRETNKLLCRDLLKVRRQELVSLIEFDMAKYGSELAKLGYAFHKNRI